MQNKTFKIAYYDEVFIATSDPQEPPYFFHMADFEHKARSSAFVHHLNFPYVCCLL